MKKFTLTLVILICAASIAHSQDLQPSSTHMFVQRDTCDLYLDIYNAKEGSQTEINGVKKPTVLFMFGGGFITGDRKSGLSGWISQLTERGYKVVSIDYRLGLKGMKKVGIAQADKIFYGISLAVEDLFSATNFLIEHANELDIDPNNIVTSGSSAGAISVMQGEYEICNKTKLASVLPEGFNYAGVMAFAGAVASKKGGVHYKSEPCPLAMFHGTSDKIVAYKKYGAFGIGLYGSDYLAKELSRKGYTDFRVLRFRGHGHEIAILMGSSVDLQEAFITENVMSGVKINVDSMIDDPRIAFSKSMAGKTKDLYK